VCIRFALVVDFRELIVFKNRKPRFMRAVLDMQISFAIPLNIANADERIAGEDQNSRQASGECAHQPVRLALLRFGSAGGRRSGKFAGICFFPESCPHA